MKMNLLIYFVLLVIGIRFFYEKRTYKTAVTPLVLFIVIYSYFTLGPYVAYMLGYNIYSGINLAYVEDSIFIFSMAIFFLCVAPAKIFFKKNYRKILDNSSAKKAGTLTYYFSIIFGNGALLYVVAVSGFSIEVKGFAIERVGSFHYVFMTLWPSLFLCLITFKKPEKYQDKILLLSKVMPGFVIYCVITGERDFILMALPIIFWFYAGRIIPISKIFLLAIILISVFVGLSVGRSIVFELGGLNSFLNQGSNLFVLSNVLDWIDQGESLRYGQTYVYSFINMLTIGLVRLDSSLAEWFSLEFSNGIGAYGFAIETEMVLNFGKWSVPVFFVILSMYISKCYQGYIKSSYFYSLLTYYNLLFLLYAIRGESLMILKSFLYVTLIYFLSLLIVKKIN